MNLLKRIWNWFVANPVVAVFGIIVAGSSLASMAHIYNFAMYFNFPFFAGMFMIAMELALVGTTIIYSRQNILATEVKDERNWWEKLWHPKKDPVIAIRKFANFAIIVFWVCVYIMNVASAYIYLNQHFPDFLTREAVWLGKVFFIPLPADILSIILCHVAAGILPFSAFIFGKMIALTVAQKEMKEREKNNTTNIIANQILEEEPEEVKPKRGRPKKMKLPPIGDDVIQGDTTTSAALPEAAEVTSPEIPPAEMVQEPFRSES